MSRLLTSGVVAARRRDPLAAISGCIFAFESWRSGAALNNSDAAPADLDAIKTINDLSGSGNALAQSVGTQQGIWNLDQINGYPAIRSDGIDDRMSWSSDKTAKTIVAVVRVLSENGLDGLIGLDDFGIRRNSSSDWRDSNSTSNAGDFTDSGVMRINGSVSPSQNLNVWGIMVATNAAPSAVQHVFGYWDFGGRILSCDLAALRLYNRVLDSGEITLFESTYSEKLAITIGP